MECIICGHECDPVLAEGGICWDCQLLNTGNK